MLRKETVRDMLVEGRLPAIAELARVKRRTLGILISLTYDTDPVVAWRAVQAMGLSAERLAPRAPDVVREQLLRRLFWLITEESGGICWYAPQGMAEVVRRLPDRFGEFAPIVMNLLVEMAEEDLGHFRPSVLWAIGRLGPVAADHLDDILTEVVAALDHPDPQVRGLAAWALGETGRGDILKERPDLLDDDAPFPLFEDGTLTETSPAAVARRALDTAAKNDAPA